LETNEEYRSRGKDLSKAWRNSGCFAVLFISLPMKTRMNRQTPSSSLLLIEPGQPPLSVGHYQRFLRLFHLDEVVPGRYSGKRRENQKFVYPRIFTNAEIPISQVDNYGLKPGRIIRVFYATQTSCGSVSIISIFNMSNEVARTGQIFQNKILAFSLKIRRYPRYSIELESLEKTQNETPCVLGDLQ